ncbi:MAG: hypothetical protein IH995_06170 [Proteobacteria bacterium]|nr:hypothetical protein [Pseudomonadota bacterium]
MTFQKRISEPELVKPVLKILDSKSNGFSSTSNLIDDLISTFKPSGKDAEIIEGRNDTFFSQKVRNLISHRKGGTNFIRRGYAVYNKENHGLSITSLGKKFIKSS